MPEAERVALASVGRTRYTPASCFPRRDRDGLGSWFRIAPLRTSGKGKGRESVQPRYPRHREATGQSFGAAMGRRLRVVAVACCSLSGCAGFWEDVTSRDFKFQEMFRPPPDPLWVLRNSEDGDKKRKALLALKEPLQNGGTRQQQEVVIKLLVDSALNDPQPLCRLAAIATLQDYKDPRAAQALIDAYERASTFQRDRPDAMQIIQEQTLQALGVNGNPIAIDLLVRIVKEPPVTGTTEDQQNGVSQRLYAVRALAHFPQYQAAEALVSVLRTEQGVALRNRSTESLRAITGQDLPADAQAWDDLLHKSGKDALAKKPTLGEKVIKLISFDRGEPGNKQ